MATKKKAKRSRTKTERSSKAGASGDSDRQAMRVEVTRIKAYERNPRRAPNPEFDRIKDSILAVGLDQPLQVTQRPGEHDFVIYGGGNTRLRILKELYEATSDDRFYWVDCVLMKWERESALLLAHLRENELRGDLNFIERAQAVMEIRALVAQESGEAEISQREFEQALKRQGYSASQALISLMGYAHARLLPLMPTVLDAGLGKLQVQRIRKLERVGQLVWADRVSALDDEFGAVFAALCRRYDSEDWQFESLQRAIEVEIAEAADISVQIIRMEFDCRLAGREPEIPAHVFDEVDEPAIAEMEGGTEAKNGSDRATGAGGSAIPEFDEDRTILVPVAAGSAEPDAAQNAAKVRRDAGTENDVLQMTRPSRKCLPLELLRETAYRLARSLARRHGLADLIMALPDSGLGYLVRDLPPAELVDQLDHDLLAQVTSIWWQLLSLSDIVVAPPGSVIEQLDPNSAVVHALRADDSDQLVEQVAVVHPGFVAHRFYRQLGQDDWTDWLCLIHNYRELHRAGRQSHVALWGPSS